MVALCNRADHYIFPVISILFLLFFLAQSQRSEIGCLPYFHTRCGLCANLECMSEMCCTRLAENTRRKKSPFRHIAQFVRLYLRSRGMYRQSEKSLLNNDTSPTCPDNMVNFGLLTAEICWRVWGTPANFYGFHVLTALLHGTLVVGVTKLCGVEQTAPPIFGRATIMLGIGPHSSF